MCVLALFVHPEPGVRLVVAANRDEELARPSAAPDVLDARRAIVGGKDLVSGGTWLGVNRQGLFVAVTNRNAPARAADSYSRGLLALETLQCSHLD